MSDDKKKDVKQDSKIDEIKTELQLNKNSLDEKAINNEGVKRNYLKNDTKPEQQINESNSFETSIDGIFDAMKSEITSIVREITEESTKSAEGSGETLSLEGLMGAMNICKEEDEEKPSKGPRGEDNFPSSDSDDDLALGRELQWSDYRAEFEKCLTKLNVTRDDMKKKSFEELCEVLAQPTALYRERKRFYSTKRKRNESVEDFLKRLTDLSSTCQFGTRQDITVADKFITSEMEKSRYSLSKTAWINLKQEVDSKKALEIADKDDLNDMERLLLGRMNSKKIPSHLAEIIRKEIMEKNLNVEWDDIAGLEFPKSIIKECIVWPMLRPDIFTGLRRLPKSLLLFGPPGTGKTMIAKCIAAQSKSTFFYVSATTIASKWYGESEQLVRALFDIAAEHQPAVIFFDEVDSLLTARSKRDHETSRRVKNEFMIHLDGAATKEETRVLFIGATNRPQDLDEAVRRRFVKRLYVPLPDLAARKQLLKILLKNHRSQLSDDDVNAIATMTNEFSGADMKWLCQDAAMEPIRCISDDGIKDIELKDIRHVEVSDFEKSLKRFRPSVASTDLTALVEWDRLYGSNSDRPDATDAHFMYT